MHTYLITFINENGKKWTLRVKASGIIPAISEGISKAFGKSWHVGHFWSPIKAEALDVKNSLEG